MSDYNDDPVAISAQASFEAASRPSPKEQAEDGDEFGAPEEVPFDVNRQIHHLMQSFSADNIGLHWKISQHAAEIDWLKQKLAEKEQEAAALNAALESELEHSRKLEGLLERGGVYLPDVDTDPAQALRALSGADDPQSVDGFLAMASGQPGLASDSPDGGR